MIRRADYSDIPRIADLMREVFARSKYAGRGTLNVKEAKALWMRSIQRHGKTSEGGTLALVAGDSDGIVTGFVLGVLQRVYLVGDQLEAQQVYLYQSHGSDPVATIELAVEFGKWAQRNDDVIGDVQSATDIVQDFSMAARIFEGLGYKQSGVIYERVLR